jgi:hypothetical protein
VNFAAKLSEKHLENRVVNSEERSAVKHEGNLGGNFLNFPLGQALRDP